MIVELDCSIQEQVEATVAKIIHEPHVRAGERVVSEKATDDEQIAADLVADQYYSELARTLKACYISEESAKPAPCGRNDKDSRITLVADPIDGSSEMVRGGPYRSALSTAVMAIRAGQLLAAAVGDIWAERIYSIGPASDGASILLCTDLRSQQTHTLRVSKAKEKLLLAQACVAAYAPSLRQQRIRLLHPLFAKTSYVHNNGGHLFSLRVVEAAHPRSYAAAMELVPVGLWEHVGAVLAMVGGAVVRRMNGTTLELDPARMQTAITAANPMLADEIEAALRSTYQECQVVHDCPAHPKRGKKS